MIPYNRPHLTGGEAVHISEVTGGGSFAGNGPFSKRCAAWLEDNMDCRRAFIVPSGTAALEMMMLLSGIGPGDEVIMPSFTFSSTANAVVLRGAKPVFSDVRPDTMNIDEDAIEAAVTPRTKAVCPVYYAGVACDMDKIAAMASRRGLMVLPDAAQAIGSVYKGRPLPSYGSMSALSFHETKNIHCGEGGALLINDPAFVERAEIVVEKGTDRSKFFRGEIDKYSWVDAGSSFLTNEITAAFLYAQFERFGEICERRLRLWNLYYERLADLELLGLIRRPVPMRYCEHNGHIFWILLNDAAARDRLMRALKDDGIGAASHYVPLHSAPMGKNFRSGDLPVSDEYSARLLRLPLFHDLAEDELERITERVRAHLS